MIDCDFLKCNCAASREPTVSSWARRENRNASVTSPKKLVALPVDLTLTNWRESPTPSTGLLMRTDSSPLVLTCPLLPPCPSTSSRCWLTWGLLANSNRFLDQKKLSKLSDHGISHWLRDFFFQIVKNKLTLHIWTHPKFFFATSLWLWFNYYGVF